MDYQKMFEDASKAVAEALEYAEEGRKRLVAMRLELENKRVPRPKGAAEKFDQLVDQH